MDEIAVGLVDVLHAIENPMKKFRKDIYSDSFREFEREHGDFFRKTENEFLVCKHSRHRMQESIEAFVSEIEKELNLFSKKRLRENKLSDYNMVLVTYDFPAILDLMPQTGKEFSECVICAWKKHFPTVDLKATTFEEINAGFKQRYCYITTAVCESLGKPDECYELNLLRDYRDDYLSSQENGEELIRRYYDIAPTIVKRINRRPDSHDIYFGIWEKYLKPCIRYIEDGDNKECMKLYTEMVYDLQNKFFVTKGEWKNER